MNVANEFLRYAVNCAEMEQLARDPASKAEWRQLADGWRRRAEQFVRARANRDSPLSRHRKVRSRFWQGARRARMRSPD
jgi:hypothetical protein